MARGTDEEPDVPSVPDEARLRVPHDAQSHEHADAIDGAAAWVTTKFREALDRLGRA